jgi:excinuclease ABC subunit B
MDNRPLKFEEFREMTRNSIYVSATPGDWEREQAKDQVVEQILRPTGLLDPSVEVRPASIQVDDALHEIRKRVELGDRVLVTVLTKRMAQELADYYHEIGVRARYLHSDIDTLERMEILRDLRQGVFDVLIGINLLREGLDLPEVSLVCVMDADKEGFLRNERSLIQTMGRASRNVSGHVLLYADRVTKSMHKAMTETSRRREMQHAHNQAHGVTPETIRRPIDHTFGAMVSGDHLDVHIDLSPRKKKGRKGRKSQTTRVQEIPARVLSLRKEMKLAASKLEFESAAELRDEIHRLEARLLSEGHQVG